MARKVYPDPGLHMERPEVESTRGAGTLGEALRTRRSLALEQQRSERLLENVLPATIAARLKAGEQPIVDAFAEVTVLFADIVDFTPHSAQLSPQQVVQTLNNLFSAFDQLARRHGLEKIKIRQKSGKLVLAWAARGDLDAATAVSNTYRMEWPPRSGRVETFPRSTASNGSSSTRRVAS